MTNIEIRRKILEMVFERFKEHPYYRVTPKEFREALKISLKDLHYNIIYLEEKGLLELQKPLEGSLFVGARITTKGIDLLEDEYKFDIMFPPDAEEALAGTNVFAELNLLIDATEAAEDINEELKELIVENIKEIQNELKKHEPRYTTVKKYAGKVKERNYEIGKKLLNTLKNPTISKILAESAKKELERM
jgi:hypothetical protein